MASYCEHCGARRPNRAARRGDNIPSIKDYAHHNEDAAYMWYSENRYDMEHADEYLDDPYDDDRDYYEEEDDMEDPAYIIDNYPLHGVNDIDPEGNLPAAELSDAVLHLIYEQHPGLDDPSIDILHDYYVEKLL